MKSNGFTLIELVVVILLLSVLSVSVVPRLSGTSDYTVITQRDQIISLLRVVQQRAMQNTQDSNTCHRIRFTSNTVGLSAQDTNGACDSGIADVSNSTLDYLTVTELESYTRTNSAGATITYLDFDDLGRPSLDASEGSCATAGCRIDLGDVQVCIESEGYIHACS